MPDRLCGASIHGGSLPRPAVLVVLLPVYLGILPLPFRVVLASRTVGVVLCSLAFARFSVSFAHGCGRDPPILVLFGSVGSCGGAGSLPGGWEDPDLTNRSESKTAN